MGHKKPDWNFAPPGAEAGIAEGPNQHAAWYRRGEKSEGSDVYQICPAEGMNKWTWMGGRKDFPVGSELRPSPFPLNNAHVEIPSVSGQELLLSALKNCVSVMDKELKGLAVIQPELMAAKAAIEACEIVDADYFEWDGEGLPPVGTVCEFAGFNPEETLPSDPLIGDRVTVIAHFKSGSIDVAAFTFFAPPDFEYLQVAQGAYGCFRPIRKPEQIAAEARDKSARQLYEDMVPKQHRVDWKNQDWVEDFYRAIDAGWGKQVDL